jgi:hypothetical protein
MNKKELTKWSVWQPLSWRWQYTSPSQLCLGIRTASVPSLPENDDAFWRWALSGRDSENLRKVQSWLKIEYFDQDGTQSLKQVRAVELIRNTQLAIQIAAPVGCGDLTVLIQHQNLISTVHVPPMTSTPWGRIIGFDNCTLPSIRRIVRGVHFSFHSKINRLINPLNFFQMGLESTNPYIRTFMWVTALDAVLMARNLEIFVKRLCNFLGENSFVLPAIDPGGQPKYRVKDVAADLYHFRSAIAHGDLIQQEFLELSGLINTTGNEISSYPPQTRYTQVLEECALFLIAGVFRKLFLEDLGRTFRNVKAWRKKLNQP